MLIDKDSIKVNGISFGQYLVEANFGYHKIWGKDTGRNLAGTNSGTLIGIFPKITMQFRKLNRTELELLAPIFDSASQTTVYYDPNKKENTTLSTYTGDWEVKNKNIIDSLQKNEGFSIAFISNKKEGVKMKARTQGFKEQIKLKGKEIEVKVSNDDVILDSETINIFKPHFNTEFFKTIMKTFEFDSNIKVPTKTWVTPEFGVKVDDEYEYLNYGQYYINDEPEYSADNRAYTHKCYDAMIEAMIPFDENPLYVEYPISYNDLLIAICNQLGWNYDLPEEYPNKDTMVEYDLYSNLGLTYRDILDDLCPATMGNFIVSDNREFKLIYPTETGDIIDEEYLKDANVNVSKKVGPINSLILSRAEEGDEIYRRDEESIDENNLNEIKIKDNLLLSSAFRENFIDEMFNKIKGFEYYSINVASTGIGYFDPLDRFTLSIYEEEYSVVLLNSELNVEGGISENLFTPELEEAVTDYSTSALSDKGKKMANIIAYKNEARIEMITQELNDNSSKIATMEQTVDGFTTTVQKVETIENQVSDLENEVENIELQRPFYRYSEYENGTAMTESPLANTKYLGTYVGVEASSDPTDYTWTLIKGADGEKGADGAKGADGTDGKDGKDGKGITATVIRYQLHTNGTTAPTGSWLSTIPTPEQGKYLWTRTTVTYTDTSEVDTYSVSYFATDGQKGTDGTGIVSTEVRYQIGTSGTVTPTGTWVNNPPAPQKGKYLWTRTIISYSDNTTSTSYATSYYALDGEKGQDGASGEDGKTLFLAYADNIDDYEGFSTDGADSNKDYYGMFVGHTQSLDPLDYEWYPSNHKIERELDTLNIDLDYTTDRVDNVEDKSDDALNRLTYQETKTNTLEQSLESVKTSMSYSGGYNLIENCIKQFGQKGWEGSFFNLTNTEIKENSLTKSALVFTNDIEVREIQTENRVHNFSFKYKKLISPANVKITINGIEILLDKHNEWTIVVVNIPVVDNLVVIKYESDTDHSAWLVDILLIPGDIRQIYTPHPSELYTDEYEMGGGKFKLKSADQNVFFEASADGIRTRNTVTNLVTSEFTEDGMYNKKSTSNEGDIAKVMMVNIGNQTWFKRR